MSATAPSACGFEAEAIKLTARSHIAGHEAREQVEDCVSDAGASRSASIRAISPRSWRPWTARSSPSCLQADAAAPLLFEEVDGDGSLRMLLMPMRLPAAARCPLKRQGKRPPEFAAQRPFVCPVMCADPATVGKIEPQNT